ncbi:glycine/sarcosine/betaine reductase selenoprotein B family protein [Denitrobaculum tricleocarpae]|uniref:Glycine reductase n=1 Tax=Denitrobaculum tricleocarpae TaxID=2591009 RepID=A0A545U2Z4_9PROT|nr:glycine/sarcosine/betaine reductase selenoprotein B family protein [Denitrobaculum tricleocarpae]TQV83841.1 glycine reductase [Denitrobaculum tricleocarpae]
MPDSPETSTDEHLSFAAQQDIPIPYLARIRSYYQALGYGKPYVWAHYSSVPFTPLTKPLADCRLALVTTAAPYQPDKGDQGPGAAYNGAAKFHRVYTLSSDSEPDLRISHISYDRQHTTAEDMRSWCPLAQMKQCAAKGEISGLTRSLLGVPTNRSQKTTLTQDAPEILERITEEGADAVVLVPNCPVCHQTVSLTARHLEANGIPTVVMACAKDIVEHVGVPRLLFSDFPLGNAAGKPNDEASQAFTLGLALQTLAAAPGPRTTVQSPLRWSDDPDWKQDFYNIERLSDQQIRDLRADFDRQKDIAKREREKSRA